MGGVECECVFAVVENINRNSCNSWTCWGVHIDGSEGVCCRGQGAAKLFSLQT